MPTDKEANNNKCACEKLASKRSKGSADIIYNCGAGCLNRVAHIECCSWTCPSGAFCKNRRFQLHQDAYVYPVKTEHKGWGILAGEFIPKGTFVMQYVGEVFSVDSELGQERLKKYSNSTCTYLMRTENNEVIDPTSVGSIARFINHSCDPNCQTQKWNVLEEGCVGIFAIKDIKENEELTFDYQFDCFKTPFTKCYCGADNCKGYLGVAPTSIAGLDSSLLSASISAPQCAYCKKMITEKDSLVFCKGPNKETYHMACIIKKEAGPASRSNRQKISSLDAKTFVCKACRMLERKRAKQPTSTSMQDESAAPDNDVAQPSTAAQYPWDSEDPQIRRFYEDNKENRTLDLIIAKEVENIEKVMQEKMKARSQQGKKRPRGGKNAYSEFSSFYNFMTELAKRLKQRIRQNSSRGKTSEDATFKFRRPKNLGEEQVAPKEKQGLKGRRKRKAGVEGETQVKEKRQSKRVTRRTKQDVGAATAAQKRARRGQRKPASTGRRKQKQDLDQAEEDVTIDLDMDNKESEKDESQSSSDEQSSNEDEDNNDEIMSEEEEDQEEQEDEIMEDEEEEEGEEDVEEDGESSSASNNQDIDDEDDQEDEEEEEEEDEEESEQEENELNLEQLQENKDEEVDGGGVHVAQEISLMSEVIGQIKQRIGAGGDSTKKQSVGKIPLKISPRKNSLLPQANAHHHQSANPGLQIQARDSQTEAQRERENIASLVGKKVQAFVQEQTYLESLKFEDFTQVRETKLNIYDSVFNMTIPDYVDDYECVPGFQIFWDSAWGGMVTLKIISTFKQFTFFTSLIQEVTDMMFKHSLLCTTSYNSYHNGFQLQYPFEIIVVQVPKNFIRKLIGYQEKNLTIQRKIYTVDFDYAKDIVSDDVYAMNETTQLRIFGLARDVRIVNESIQKELEDIKMKTIFLQMNDCRLVMDHIKEVKVQVDPCEIRVKRMTRDWKDLRHPFFYLPNYLREIVLIGNTKEIDDAEKVLEKFFQVKRDLQKVNMQQISYLLPIQFKPFHNDIKQELLRRFNNHLQVYFYEPTFPRKHITVLMIGDWKMLLQGKDLLETQVNRIMGQETDQSFESFQEFTYHQQVRFSFKSLKRFVLERDIQYLNHWDMVSIYVENLGKQRQAVLPASSGPFLPPPLPFLAGKSLSTHSASGELNLTSQQLALKQAGELHQKEELKRRQQEDEQELRAFIRYIKEEDIETCLNTLFVLTDSDPDQMEHLMKRLFIGRKEFIVMMSQILKRNIDQYHDSIQFSHNKPYYQVSSRQWGISGTVYQASGAPSGSSSYYPQANSTFYRQHQQQVQGSMNNFQPQTANSRPADTSQIQQWPQTSSSFQGGSKKSYSSRSPSNDYHRTRSSRAAGGKDHYQHSSSYYHQSYNTRGPSGGRYDNDRSGHATSGHDYYKRRNGNSPSRSNERRRRSRSVSHGHHHHHHFSRRDESYSRHQHHYDYYRGTRREDERYRHRHRSYSSSRSASSARNSRRRDHHHYYPEGRNEAQQLQRSLSKEAPSSVMDGVQNPYHHQVDTGAWNQQNINNQLDQTLTNQQADVQSEVNERTVIARSKPSKFDIGPDHQYTPQLKPPYPPGTFTQPKPIVAAVIVNEYQRQLRLERGYSSSHRTHHHHYSRSRDVEHPRESRHQDSYYDRGDHRDRSYHHMQQHQQHQESSRRFRKRSRHASRRRSGSSRSYSSKRNESYEGYHHTTFHHHHRQFREHSGERHHYSHRSERSQSRVNQGNYRGQYGVGGTNNQQYHQHYTNNHHDSYNGQQTYNRPHQDQPSYSHYNQHSSQMRRRSSSRGRSFSRGGGDRDPSIHPTFYQQHQPTTFAPQGGEINNQRSSNFISQGSSSSTENQHQRLHLRNQHQLYDMPRDYQGGQVISPPMFPPSSTDSAIRPHGNQSGFQQQQYQNQQQQFRGHFMQQQQSSYSQI